MTPPELPTDQPLSALVVNYMLDAAVPGLQTADEILSARKLLMTWHETYADEISDIGEILAEVADIITTRAVELGLEDPQ